MITNYDTAFDLIFIPTFFLCRQRYKDHISDSNLVHTSQLIVFLPAQCSHLRIGLGCISYCASCETLLSASTGISKQLCFLTKIAILEQLKQNFVAAKPRNVSYHVLHPECNIRWPSLARRCLCTELVTTNPVIMETSQLL